MSTPPGLYYYPTAIPEDLAERLTTFVEQDCALFPVPGHNGTVSANARQVAHYGYRYDYTSGGTNEAAPDFPQSSKSCVC